MKTKHYWKVLRKEGGGYISSSSVVFGITYKLGKLNVPKMGKIFIFNTRKRARDFKRGSFQERNLEVFKVKANGVTPAPEFIPALSQVNYNRFPEWWEHYATEHPASFYLRVMDTPSGTLLADSIIPLENI